MNRVFPSFALSDAENFRFLALKLNFWRFFFKKERPLNAVASLVEKMALITRSIFLFPKSDIIYAPEKSTIFYGVSPSFSFIDDDDVGP